MGRVKSVKELTTHPERETLAPSPLHLESGSGSHTPRSTLIVPSLRGPYHRLFFILLLSILFEMQVAASLKLQVRKKWLRRQGVRKPGSCRSQCHWGR